MDFPNTQTRRGTKRTRNILLQSSASATVRQYSPTSACTIPGGSYYGKMPQGKKQYWQDYWKTVRRRNAVKRFLVRVPFLSGLNSRFDWFGPVEWEPAPLGRRSLVTSPSIG